MGSAIRDRINQELKEAIKGRQEIATATLRLMLAALKDRDIAARSKGNDSGISEDEILSLIQTMIKQRHESAKAYEIAARNDLADREKEEIKILETFLPPQMSEDQIEKLVEQMIIDTDASGVRDMGRLMGILKEKYAGQMDFSLASQITKAKLSAL